MADDPKPDPKPDDPNPDPAPDPKPDPKPDDDFDRDRAMNTIRQQREEEKRLRAELREAKEKADRLDQLEAEKLTEQEKLAKRVEEAEAKAATAAQKIQQANLLVALTNPDLGIVNAKAAAKLIDGVEYDTDGNPSNLDDILPAFLEENAFLVAAGATGKPKAPDLNAAGGGKPGDGPKLTADELAMAGKLGMTADEYAAYKTVSTIEEHQAVSKKLAGSAG